MVGFVVVRHLKAGKEYGLEVGGGSESMLLVSVWAHLLVPVIGLLF